MAGGDRRARGPSLASVLQRRGGDLALDPVVGDPERAAGALAGHLNLVQPNRVRVLGTTEVRSWTSRDATERARLLDALFDAEPHAVIVADGLDPPPEFLERARATGCPLLRASADCDRVIRALRHDLGYELPLELVSRGHSLVADDAPEFRRNGPDTIEGEAPALLRDFLEVSGLGVLNVRAMYGDAAIRMRKRLQLIIHLESLNAALREQLDRLNGNLVQTDFLGVEVDAMTLPVAPGRNQAVLVEAAVRDFLLIRRGYRAGDDLIARQAAATSKDGSDACA